MNTKIISVFLSVILFASCMMSEDIDIISYEPQIVVEGSIENGGYASVLLSISAPMTGAKDTLSLLNHVIRSAKVTVSNDTQSEILTLSVNKDNMPPYEYRGSVIEGKVGEKYNLKIEYQDKIITSQTYIPSPVKINQLEYAQTTADGGYIYIQFDNISTDYYQVLTKTRNIQSRFIPCMFGNIDPTLYPKNDPIKLQINKGPVIFPIQDLRTYFENNQLIDVKFSTQPKEAYDFWNSYQNEILNTQNPIFPASSQLKSNIIGGIGIWSGYGSYTYSISTKP